MRFSKGRVIDLVQTDESLEDEPQETFDEII